MARVQERSQVASKDKLEAEFCPLGDRNCKRFTKLGMCSTPECPIVAKERRMAAKAARPSLDTSKFIDVDLPFDVKELESLTSPLYVECLGSSDWPRPKFKQEHQHQ